MTRNRFTRHDGPLSVQRAYTRMELRALLAGAALRPIAEAGAFAGHRVAIAAVPMRELERQQASGTGAGTDMTRRASDVVVVGGGPAGAVTAAYLARAGHESSLLERSPASVARRRRVRLAGGGARAAARGLDAETLGRVARPIPAMRVELPDAARTRSASRTAPRRRTSPRWASTGRGSTRPSSTTRTPAAWTSGGASRSPTSRCPTTARLRR